ncbi:MAG: response regulator [Dehalococcoidales bacterium]|nr:response regulator [Dehalococcoidales bacterium]
MNTGKKILLVSQNTHFVNSIGHNLSKQNYRVKGTRANNEELLHELSTIIPDLTILDTPLASMNGIRELISIRETMDTSILMLSTQDSRADTVKILSIGSYSHPTIKPMTFEQLIGQINQLMNKRI